MNIEVRREYALKYLKNHREEVYERRDRWFEKNPDKRKSASTRQCQRRKLAAMQRISALEKPACKKCGCDDLRILEINHKNLGGTVDIKKWGGSWRFYDAIAAGRRPVNDLEVLCKVCNAAHYVEEKYGIIFQVTFLPANIYMNRSNTF